MKIKGLAAKTFAFMIFCGVMAITGQAQEKLPPNTKEGFVTTSDGVRIHYFAAGPRSGINTWGQACLILLGSGLRFLRFFIDKPVRPGNFVRHMTSVRIELRL